MNKDYLHTENHTPCHKTSVRDGVRLAHVSKFKRAVTKSGFRLVWSFLNQIAHAHTHKSHPYQKCCCRVISRNAQHRPHLDLVEFLHWMYRKYRLDLFPGDEFRRLLRKRRTTRRYRFTLFWTKSRCRRMT